MLIAAMYYKSFLACKMFFQIALNLTLMLLVILKEKVLLLKQIAIISELQLQIWFFCTYRTCQKTKTKKLTLHTAQPYAYPKPITHVMFLIEKNFAKHLPQFHHHNPLKVPNKLKMLLEITDCFLKQKLNML